MKKLSVLALLCLLLGGCSWFDYHPYDGHLKGELDINRKNIAKIEKKLTGKTSFKFAFITDTQRMHDDTKDAVKNINSRTDIDFVMHGGDIADFGLTEEFMWQRDILNRLTIPYVVILGNHDCLANGQEVFEAMFGDFNYTFMAGDVKFVCLNTNALEQDYSIPVPDFKFIRANNDGNPAHKRTIFGMHARPFTEQFNNNVADVFQDELKEYPNLIFCVNGHEHIDDVRDLFGDGVMYHGVKNIGKREYCIFTITDDGYSYETIKF